MQDETQLMETQNNNTPNRKPRVILNKFLKDIKDTISAYWARIGAAIRKNNLLKTSRDEFITGLEIDLDQVKLAKLKKTAQGLKLVKLVVKKISPFESKEGPRALMELLEEDSQTRKGNLVVSLPRHSTVVRRILFLG